MKVVELLKIGRLFCETLQKACIKSDDVRFVDMFDEYTEMYHEGHKITYIAASLSDKYNISERQFFYVIKRLSKDCKIPANQ